MHDASVQQRFIDLRVQGWSFARIAKELDVSKRTLIDWSLKFQFDIQNARAIELEALQEAFLSSRETRVRALGEQLRLVEEELKKRNVAELPTTRLFTLADTLRRQIIQETGNVQFSTPVDKIPKDDFHEEVQDWKG